MKMKMKKSRKMSLIYEFFVLKLDYVAILVKNVGQNF